MLLRRVPDPQRPAFAVVLFMLLTVVYLYPTIFQLNDHLIGGSDDAWVCPWNNFNFRERVLDGKDPYFTDYIFAPVGTHLLMHANTEFNSVVGLLLSPWLNDVGQANFAILLATFLSALGAYLLAWELTRNRIAALFAGIGFAFCPFRILRMAGHTNFATSQWLPLALWSFFKMADTGRLKYALLTGLFFALNYYSNQYYAVYIAVAFLFLWLYGVWRFPEWRTLRLVRSLAIAGVAAAVLLAPVAIRFYHDHQEGITYQFSPSKTLAERTSADLIDFFRPAPFNQLVVKLFGEEFFRGAHAKFTAGWVLMITAFIGLYYSIRNRQRKIVLLAILGLFFLLMSLGPVSRIGPVTIPLPYHLLREVPLVNHVRIPSRFAIMVSLAAAIVGAYAVAVHSRRKAVTLAAFALLLFELFPAPIYMKPFQPPSVFYELRDKPDGLMLTLPFYVGNAPASRPMSFQLAHHKPIFSGRTARGGPWEVENYFMNLPITQYFFGISARGPRPTKSIQRDAQLGDLFRRFFNVRYLSIHPPFSRNAAVEEYIEKVFPDRKLLSNEQGIEVFELEPVEMDTFEFRNQQPGMRFFLFTGWEPGEADGKRIFVSKQDTPKMMLPVIEEDQIIDLEFKMRSRDPKILDEGRLWLTLNDHLLHELFLKPEYRSWTIQIRGDRLLEARQILNMQFVYPHSDAPRTDSSIRAQILSISARIRR